MPRFKTETIWNDYYYSYWRCNHMCNKINLNAFRMSTVTFLFLSLSSKLQDEHCRGDKIMACTWEKSMRKRMRTCKHLWVKKHNLHSSTDWIGIQIRHSNGHSNILLIDSSQLDKHACISIPRYVVSHPSWSCFISWHRRMHVWSYFNRRQQQYESIMLRSRRSTLWTHHGKIQKISLPLKMQQRRFPIRI